MRTIDEQGLKYACMSNRESVLGMRDIAREIDFAQ